MSIRLLVRALLLPLALAALASAQTFPFQFLVTQSGRSVDLQNGGTIPFVAHVGQPQIATVRATYTGTGTANVLEAPTLVGSQAFTTKFTGAVPLTLKTGNSYSFEITFLPTTP